MKNVLALIGAVTVAVGVVAAAALVVKKYLDKVEEKKRIEEEEALFGCDGTCCDLGFDEEEEGIDWGDIPVEDDDEELSESIKELDGLDIEEKQ